MLDPEEEMKEEREERELLRRLNKVTPSDAPVEEVEPTADAKVEKPQPTTRVRRHVSGGEPQRPTRNEAECEEAPTEAVEAQRSFWLSVLHYTFKFLSGEIVALKEVKRLYNYLIYIAIVFLTSIFVLFAALSQDTRREKLDQEVTSLREKSIRTHNELTRESSHARIMERIEAEQLGLTDTENQVKIVD